MSSRKVAYCLAVSLALGACSPRAPTPVQKTPAESTAAKRALDPVIESVRASRGPGSGDMILSLVDGQFTVQVINSPLNESDHSARNVEAASIVHAIEISTAGKPQFATATGIHINFVARPADGGKERQVDAIDFRKDAAGHFTLHVT